ncbi:hypothetical protein CYMTET_37531 [Cymbomonas tetramitiformis]|uniref:Uncharacterized protein n=1 Tax=Cymbomonas tetramitiformis TaxID=36881 RepID=A0AAE0F5W7_9CHLO|nr:hypothetical protein CYMTET_37531 [Cymbomonas tetramitiformis]
MGIRCWMLLTPGALHLFARLTTYDDNSCTSAKISVVPCLRKACLLKFKLTGGVQGREPLCLPWRPNDILQTVSKEVLSCLDQEPRGQLTNEVHTLIAHRVSELIRPGLDYAARRKGKKTKFSDAPKRRPLRFARFDRVVCLVGGDRQWASGNIQSLNEVDPSNPTVVFPYVVKTDPPQGRLISVPSDENDTVRAEVCFGQREGAMWFTLFCMPATPNKSRRFGVGDRVACAVEDETGDYSSWLPGTVLEMEYCFEEAAKKLLPDWEWDGVHGRVPYQVQLDTGVKVLVHRDEHWLVRDLRLQEAGIRQAANGVHCCKRIERRQRNGVWQAVDHKTCKVRPCDPPESDDSD